MNALAKDLAATLDRLRRSIPGVESMSVRAQSSNGKTSLYLETASEEALRDIAEALGLPTPGDLFFEDGSSVLRLSQFDVDGTHVHACGPLRRSARVAVDSIRSACAAAVESARAMPEGGAQ